MSKTLLLALSLSLVGCGARQQAATAVEDDKANVVNTYNWADYIAPDTATAFTRDTGIKVLPSYFDSNETLETRMLTGHSGFDVVFTPLGYFERQIRSGAYQQLDKGLLPNAEHLDPEIMAKVAAADPDNKHGMVYLWGTFGLGYNEKMVAAALPGVPVDSWGLLFNPDLASKLASCGIHFYDDAPGLFRLILLYLGRNPSTPSVQDFNDVEKVLMAIRPHVRMIDNVAGIQALANGDICVSLGNNGDFVVARRRAQEAKHGITVRYLIPKEGSLLWFTLLAIPSDAPHPANAHRFIDYLMRPDAIAHITNVTGYANANLAGGRFLDGALAGDSMIFPTPDERKRLYVDLENSAEQARQLTRLWQRFKTGQ